MPRLRPRRALRKGKRPTKHPAQKRRQWNLRTLLRQEGGLCVYCRKPVTLVPGDPRQATIDHEIPTSRGGLDEIGNLKLACQACNQAKGHGVTVDLYLGDPD